MADSLYFKSFLLVLLAGFIWSFGAVVVRQSEDPEDLPPVRRGNRESRECSARAGSEGSPLPGCSQPERQQA